MKQMSNKIHQNGYAMVCLHGTEGRIRVVSIGRLILETFRPIEGMEKMDACHLDDNTQNNRLSNMEWMTHAGNLKHKAFHSRSSRNKPVYVIYNDQKTLTFYRTRKDCPIQDTTITHCTCPQNLYSHYSKKYECWIYREEQLPEEYREKAEGMRRIADEMSLTSFSIKTDPNPIRKPYRKRNQNNNDDNGDTAHTDTD